MPSDFLEKNLEDIIYENQDKVVERGFPRLYAHTERQFILPDGTILDLFSWEVIDDIFYAKIFELKKDIINDAAYWQGIGYYIQVMLAMMGNFKDSHVELFLVGTDCTPKVLESTLISPILFIYSYNYDWDGVSFKCLSDGRNFLSDGFYNSKPIVTFDKMIAKFKNGELQKLKSD